MFTAANGTVYFVANYTGMIPNWGSTQMQYPIYVSYNHHSFSPVIISTPPHIPAREPATFAVRDNVQHHTTPIHAAMPANGAGATKPFLTFHNRTVSSDPVRHKLYVPGLSCRTTSAKLRKYFSQYGRVALAYVVKDRLTQISRGYGFVLFESPFPVLKALMTPHTLDGVVFYVGYANRPYRIEEEKTVFVGGIAQSLCSEDLKKYFCQFGAVKEVVMIYHRYSNCHRGYGFVTFCDEAVAKHVRVLKYHCIERKNVVCRPYQRNAKRNN